jgi:HSP20 family protein
MAIQRWEPWTEMLTLREAMGRLLEDSYVRPASTGAGLNFDAMPLDVFEDADNVEVRATLPGLRPEDVEITLQGDTLTIKGQQKASTERKQGNYLLREHRSGNFYRSVKLPMLLDSAKAEARFEHGVLTLTLPKAEATKPRQIRISTSAPQNTLEAKNVQAPATTPTIEQSAKHEPQPASHN